MKWLLLFPAWVFLISYVIYRVKEANRDALGDSPALVQAAAPASLAGFLVDEPEPSPQRAAAVSAAEVARLSTALGERVSLLPLKRSETDPGVSPLWPPRSGNKDEAILLATRPNFENWKLYETDEMSFLYPDAPGFRVEVLLGGESLPMLGEIFHRTDVPPERWYRVVGPGEATWGAVGVDRGTDFDGAERYPTPELFHKLLLVGGGIARASNGEDGSLCRVQWLGRGIRVSLLGWQHCASHRDAYLSLAASVAVAPQYRRNRADLGALVGGASLETRLGLLEPGMAEAAVEGVLGRPAGMAEGTWVFHVPNREGDRYYRVPFEKGVFWGFKDDWRTVRKDPPIKGSIQWMLEKTEMRVGKPGGVGYDLGVLTDEEVEFIFSEISGQLPSATGGQWESLCEIIANMAEMRLKDGNVLTQLKGRFLEPGLETRRAALVLRSWDAEAARDIFLQKGRDLLGDLRWKSGAPSDGGPMVEDIQMLVAYVGERHPKIGLLVNEAAAHPHEAVRAMAMSFCHWLPDAEQKILLASGIGDPAKRVRCRCAEVVANGAASLIGRAALVERLGVERDPETRDHLASAIAALGADSPD